MKIFLLEPSPKIPGLYYTRSKGTFGHAKSNFVRPPVDLMVLAGFLRSRGHSVLIEDANVRQLSHQAVRQKIAGEAPDILIINTSTPTVDNDLLVCRKAKEDCPDIRTVAIGVHVMALPVETLHAHEALDAAVITEPELPVLHLVEAGGDPAGVPGLAWKDGGTVRINDPGEKLRDLDSLGLPAHDLVPLHLYHDPAMKLKPMTTTLMSRGCRHACIFCSSGFYAPYRLRSPESVWEELDWITRDMGVREVKFFDSLFNGDPGWVQTFCERLVSKGPVLSWYCSTRADSLTQDVLRLMKSAGCHTIHMGIESASPSILASMNKQLDLAMVEKAVRWAKSAGMQVVGYFIFGMPGETEETMRETIDYARRLQLDMASFNLAIPHPGTPFHDYLLKAGWLKAEDWGAYDTGNTASIYTLPTISNEDLQRLIKAAYRSFYFRPEKIYSLLKNSRGNMSILKNYVKNASGILANYLLR